LIDNQLLSIKQIYLFGAPLLEELLKATLLLAVVGRMKALQPGEGALYGFSFGVGFAIAESVAYMSSDPTQAMSIAAARSVSVNLMHGIGIALVGYGIAIYVRSRLNLIPTVILLGGAVVLHAANNYLTLEMGMYGTASAIALSVTGISLIALLAKMGGGFVPQENAIIP
jgi:RsiW-degrading membrane proteinase PrsW (M82 family)